MVELWTDWIYHFLEEKKNLVACSLLLKGKWEVIQWDYELHTFDGTDSKGAELFEQRDLFQPNCPPAP